MPRPTPKTTRTGLPASWSASVCLTYTKIREGIIEGDSASIASLYEACNLLATADTMQTRVDLDGLVGVGSQGQPVAHPLISEIRLARVQALTALKPLRAPSGVGSAASRAGTALVSARHQKTRA